MPTVDALYRRYKDRGLEVLAINLDAATTSKVQAFVRELGVTFRVGLDPSSSIARTYRAAALPTSYLIDRAGNVVVQEVGARDWLDAVSRLAIEGLLQLPEPAQEARRSPVRWNDFFIRGSDVFMTK
jgi:peroxiredoxin